MNKILRVSLVFGAVGLAACIANFMITRAIGLNPFIEFHLVDVPILVVSIVGAILFYKYFVNFNELHLWQGIAVGFLVYIFIVNLYGLFIFCFLEYVDPSLLQPYIKALQAEQIKYKLDIIKQLDITEDEFMKNRVLALNTSKPKDIAINEMVRKLLIPIPFFNILVIFISSLFLRKINK